MSGDVEVYLAELAGRIEAALGEALVGVYLMGSAGMGAAVPGVSDLDVWALVRGPPAEAAKRALVARVDQAALPCPARGLELVVARFGDGPEPRVELNLNDGPRMARRVALDASDEPRHWFVLDAAIGRRHGRALAGPPPEEAFPPIPRSLQLAAIGESLDWYAEHEPDNRKAVLTAARGWRYIAEGRWSSKEEAAAWAAERRPDLAPELEAALEARRAPTSFQSARDRGESPGVARARQPSPGAAPGEAA